MAEQTKDMLGRTALTSVDTAQKLLLDAIANIRMNVEAVSLHDSLNRITSEDIFSSEDLPPHPRSTMDGYAVIAKDTFGASQTMPAYLNIIGEVFMGRMPSMEISRGNCVKIPTGGLLPAGADTVVMYENTVPVDENLIEITKDTAVGTAVIQKGEDIGSGQQVIPSGKVISPYDLGLLAGIGITSVSVTKKVRVGVLSTGDEIIHHTKQTEMGQIRDSNAVALSGVIRQAGAEFVDLGIVSDKKDIFFPALQNGIDTCDMVLFSGGSSVGTRDLGEQAIESLSPGILVHGVSLKPGKPVIIGLHGTKPVIGLPGHPVSALVCFEAFVLPAIRSLAGLATQHKDMLRPPVVATLTRNINSAAGRRDIIRTKLIQDKEGNFNAVPVLGKSGSISTLSKADGYFIIPESEQGSYEGSIVEVHII